MERIQAFFDQYATAMAQLPLWKTVLITALIIGITFLPTLVAVVRNPSNLKGIFLLNLGALLSWTLWAGALIWAGSGKSIPEKLAKKLRRKTTEPQP